MRKIIGLIVSLLFISQFTFSQILTPVKWTFEISDIDDSSKEIVATASIDEHWKMYGTNLPEGGPISTVFIIEAITGASIEGDFLSSSQPKLYYDAMFQMELSSYEKKAVFTQRLKIIDKANFSVKGYVRYMACDATSCLPPTEASFSFGSEPSQTITMQHAIDTPFWGLAAAVVFDTLLECFVQRLHNLRLWVLMITELGFQVTNLVRCRSN